MQYAIVALLCSLATAKVTLQSNFSKKHVNNIADATFFNGLVFVFSALLFAVNIPGTPLGVWLYAAAFAVFTVMFQLSYTEALKYGSVSITVMMTNLSMIIPTLFSFFAYGESLSPLRAIGIVLTLLTFVIGTRFSSNEDKAKKQWLIFAIVAVLANGGLGITQKIFGYTPYKDLNKEFVACAYIIATVLTAIVYLVLYAGHTRKTAEFNRITLLVTALIGVILAVFQMVNTYAIATVDGTFLFPAYSGCTLICSTLVGIVLFKDRITRRQMLSLSLSLIATVLMNF